MDTPILVGGVGGSGTRVIAAIMQAMGVNIGSQLNSSLDNLWFSLLFKRKQWQAQFPSDQDIFSNLAILEKAMTTGLLNTATPQELAIIRDAEQDCAMPAKQPMLIADSLRNSTGSASGEYATWGLKEPNSHMFLSQIARFFSTARYIMVVRSGLDIAFSSNQNQVRTWGPMFGILTEGQQTITPEISLDYWLATHSRSLATLKRDFTDRHLVVYYEELVSNPQKGISQIADFLQLSPSVQAVKDVRDGIFKSPSIGRYQEHSLNVFRPDQIEALSKFGYSIPAEAALNRGHL